MKLDKDDLKQLNFEEDIFDGYCFKLNSFDRNEEGLKIYPSSLPIELSDLITKIVEYARKQYYDKGFKDGQYDISDKLNDILNISRRTLLC